MKLDAKSILVPTAVLFVICVVVSAALAGTNLLTKEKIAEQQALKAEESRRIVLDSADSFEAQDNGETPGLGANAEKEDFRNQYKQAAPESGIEIVKYQTPAEGQIEAMTGATITTKAVTQAVNQAVEKFYTVKGGA